MRRTATWLLALAACGGEKPADQSTQRVVVITSGNGQVATAGQALPQPLVVSVTENGTPRAGVALTWEVVSGGGALLAAAATTGPDGSATATWKLGPVAGLNELRVVAVDADAPVQFSATATAPPLVPSIQLVSTVAVPPNYGHHDTFVREGIAFVSAWNSGLYIYDVGNGIRNGSPANPVLVSRLTTATNGVPGGAQVHNAWWFHNPVSHEKRYLFVGQEGPGTVGASSSGDLHVVDVSDLSQPVEVASLRIPGAGVHNFWMDEPRQVLYAAFYNGGVVELDVSGVLSGSLSGRILAESWPGGVGGAYTWGVQVEGNTLFASDMLNGLWAFDKVTLASKQSSATVTNRFTSDLAIRGSIGYTGTWGTRNGVRGNAINLFTLGASGVPSLAGTVVIPNISTVSDVAISPDGTQLIATAEGGSAPGLYLFDRRDPLNPILSTKVVVPNGLHTGEVSVIGGRTFVFAARNPPNPALMIFDVTGTP